jgi:hypothetical protein
MWRFESSRQLTACTFWSMRGTVKVMRNKLKIVVIIVAVVAGIVLYKNQFDKKEREKQDKKAKDKLN